MFTCPLGDVGRRGPVAGTIAIATINTLAIAMESDLVAKIERGETGKVGIEFGDVLVVVVFIVDVIRVTHRASR